MNIYNRIVDISVSTILIENCQTPPLPYHADEILGCCPPVTPPITAVFYGSLMARLRKNNNGLALAVWCRTRYHNEPILGRNDFPLDFLHLALRNS